MKRSVAILQRLERAGFLPLTEEIARAHGVTAQAVARRDQRRGPSAARHALLYAIRHDSTREWSYPELGRLLGLTNKTTRYGVLKHAAWLASPRGPVSCAAAVPAGAAGCCA